MNGIYKSLTRYNQFWWLLSHVNFWTLSCLFIGFVYSYSWVVLLLGPFYVLILVTKNNYLYFCLHFLVLNLRGVCLGLMLDNKPKSVFLSMTERWFILFFLNCFFNDKERGYLVFLLMRI